jgi:hypothetical protein
MTELGRYEEYRVALIEFKRFSCQCELGWSGNRLSRAKNEEGWMLRHVIGAFAVVVAMASSQPTAAQRL